MNSKSPRLLTLLASTALLLAALCVGAPGAPAAPKKCPQGKTAWKLEGRSACLPSPVAGSRSPAGPAIAELWLREASRPMPGGKLQLSPALRRALPRAGTLLADEIADADGGAGASISSRGPVVERVDQVIGQEDLGNGVVAEGRIKGRVFEDDSVDLEVELELRDRKGNSVLFSPDFKDFFAKEEAVGCPTATGVVIAETKGQVGGTVIARKGKRVVASRTVSQSWQIRARGQVGTDARLHSVTTDVSLTMKKFERGLQLETTFGTAATVSREGAPKAAGTPTANVSVRAALASREEERAYELEAARLLASSPELAESVAGVADISRDRLLAAEPTWYDLPNECAQLTWEPGAGITLEPNETRRLTGTVIAKRDGGPASGRIELGGVSPGRLIPITPGFSAAAPASFIAAGGEPNAAGLSVHAATIATSTAGRAQATWSARATPVKLPLVFNGTIASTKSMAGLTRASTAAPRSPGPRSSAARTARSTPGTNSPPRPSAARKRFSVRPRAAAWRPTAPTARSNPVTSSCGCCRTAKPSTRCSTTSRSPPSSCPLTARPRAPRVSTATSRSSSTAANRARSRARCGPWALTS